MSLAKLAQLAYLWFSQWPSWIYDKKDMNEQEQKFQKKMKDGFFLLGTFFITDVLVSFARTQKSLLVALSAFSISPLSILFPKFLRWGAEICPNVRLDKYLLKMFLQPIS